MSLELPSRVRREFEPFSQFSVVVQILLVLPMSFGFLLERSRSVRPIRFSVDGDRDIRQASHDRSL
jgi:hypothetical protein